jgi:hypothetical protein
VDIRTATEIRPLSAPVGRLAASHHEGRRSGESGSEGGSCEARGRSPTMNYASTRHSVRQRWPVRRKKIGGIDAGDASGDSDLAQKGKSAPKPPAPLAQLAPTGRLAAKSPVGASSHAGGLGGHGPVGLYELAACHGRLPTVHRAPVGASVAPAPGPSGSSANVPVSMPVEAR